MQSSMVVEVCNLCECLATVNARMRKTRENAKIVCRRFLFTKRKDDRLCGFARDCVGWPAAKSPSGSIRKCIFYLPNGS
jgi:hypothetical protein